VSELLVPSLARLGLRGRAVEAQVLAAWPEAVGEAVARETHCAGLSRGRLTIESTSSALSHQLLMQKQTIIDTLNLQLGDDLVRDLRFRLLAAPPGEKAAVNPGRRGRAAR
jgi:predicted nucleic acid-binding Zn ribbon protein